MQKIEAMEPAQPATVVPPAAINIRRLDKKETTHISEPS